MFILTLARSVAFVMSRYMKAAAAFIACLWHSDDKLLLVTCISQPRCEQNVELSESTEW